MTLHVVMSHIFTPEDPQDLLITSECAYFLHTSPLLLNTFSPLLTSRFLHTYTSIPNTYTRPTLFIEATNVMFDIDIRLVCLDKRKEKVNYNTKTNSGIAVTRI